MKNPISKIKALINPYWRSLVSTYCIQKSVKETKQLEKKLVAAGLNSQPWCTYSYGRRISMSNPEDIYEARKWLREFFGHWSDSVGSIYHSHGETMLVEWKAGEGLFGLTINSRFNVNEIPEGLLADTCTIVEDEQSPSYSVVCQDE